MTELLQNAIASIQLGIEDYRANDDRRSISAVRNFYAGVLLLGKQCLLSTAPDADPMDILASKFSPTPDGMGGITHRPNGFQTIDLNELRQRFKDFDLKWPNGEITTLQKLRNDFEHYHSAAPKVVIQQAIAACFPLVVGFFEILELEPAAILGDAWTLMLAEKTFFKQRKAEADATFEKLPWGNKLSNTDAFSCPECSSALICQVDPLNKEPASIGGRCVACGKTLSAEEMVTLIVDAEFGIDDYIAAKDGDDPVIHDCPECWNSTYVANGEWNECLLCGHEINGECSRCMTELTIESKSINDPSLCHYCYHVMSKDD